MAFARRTAALRLTAMAALAVSALLISDHLNPDRAFCPMEEACEAARSSALGSLFGVPTSILGMVAFGGLFFLTLLPVEWGRRPLQVAGFLAAVAGAGFILYQATMLQRFCPLCLVADGAGLVAGLLTLTWPPPPIRASGRRILGEGGASRMAWTLAGVLAAIVPFAWPRPEVPSWVEIPEQAAMDFEDETEGPELVETTGPDPYEASAPAPVPVPAQIHPTAIVSTARWRTPHGIDAGRGERTSPSTAPPPPEAAPAAEGQPRSVRTPSTPEGRSLAVTATPGADPASGSTARPSPPPAPTIPAQDPRAPRPSQAPSASVPTPKPATRPRRGPVIVEYLNAYCAHCRATHTRLEKVLKEMGLEVQRRRVYAWAANGYPLWVRACSYAREQGMEERFFQELLRAPNQNASQIYAAARRAGLDVVALQCALQVPTIPEHLRRDCDRMRNAGLQGLPTLDIGRRRLMGEQSEAELREAIQAALNQDSSP